MHTMRDVARRIPIEVPFLDLAASHAPLRDGFLADFDDVIASSGFVNGPQVSAFEKAFADYCQAAHCVGLASGLDALRLALAGCDVGEGDEVIVPALTFIATWEAVSQLGAVPKPVDVSEVDYCLDVEAAEAALTPRVRAVVPVHLYGQLADLDALEPIVTANDLVLIEDAAQAHGASRGGRSVGSRGSAAAFSFYPGKNLGAMGDAGALVTGDDALARRVRALREHGQQEKYHHDVVGWTARLDTIQAAILYRKLPFLTGWNEERRDVATYYLEALHGIGDLVLPPVVSDSHPVWHVFVVRTKDPEGLREHLFRDGVVAARHYPVPPHLSRAYSSLRYEVGSFPVAESIARECLSLPIFPGMTQSQAARVVASVTTWFSG